MPSFDHDHRLLLELADIFEPKKQYSFDFTFASIDNEITTYELWDEEIDGISPSEEPINCTPENWYIQYWFNCAQNHICADLDGYEFREICDYSLNGYDETIYTGHPLDLY